MGAIRDYRRRAAPNLPMAEREHRGEKSMSASKALNLNVMTSPQPRVLCIAPAWNEGERIARVVEAVPQDIVEATVVVDDGSSDTTGDYAERAGATVIRQGANRGVGAAIRAGIDYARANGYDIVVIVSGGGKTPPEQIPRL